MVINENPLYIPEPNRAGLIYWRFNLQHKFIRHIFLLFLFYLRVYFSWLPSSDLTALCLSFCRGRN